MKKFAITILVSLLITTVLTGYSEKLSNELSEGIVRLHIVADSNSVEDQRVKLKIRDRVLEEMKAFESKDDVKENIMFFESVANSVLKEEGFDYTAKALWGCFEFPTKHYENFSLPRGEYEAVKIELGRAEGENWWCVLFPPLCMIDGSTEQSDKMLRDTFGDNYAVVTRQNTIPVKIKFKLAELF